MNRPRRQDLPSIAELIPWHTVDVSVWPFGQGWWPFNPSIHFWRGEWRCVIRCANYSLPGGVVVMSPEARAGKAQTRNAIVLLDPSTLEIRCLSEVGEPSQVPRAPECSCLGLEDMRLFWTRRDGLTGVATALQYNIASPSRPEVVLCYLDRDYQVSDVVPIRGEWSCRPQKNWAPFDGAAEPRLLYSIERGVVMGERGPEAGTPAPVATRAERTAAQAARGIGVVAAAKRSGAEVKIVGGPRVEVAPPVRRSPPERVGSDGLRGGSQLTRIGADRWIGVAHEMTLAHQGGGKLYWHTVYACDDRGALVARSRPVKLSARHDIEFAAGLAVDDGGRAVISFGVDDNRAILGVTTLAGLVGMLEPVTRGEVEA